MKKELAFNVDQQEIIRSDIRVKQTGEVFTPLPLVDEILSKLPEDTWAVEKTFIDPAAGDGNFLVRVVAWKIQYGATAKQALETTYGVDLMEDNVAHCRMRMLTNAYAAQAYKKTSNELLPHLSAEDERAIGMARGHDAFARKHTAIVQRNIVCHDALTYDYSFGEVADSSDAGTTDRLQSLGIEF